jgi:leader peptidase (prepilin peptidase)/N-methyltransferase
VADPVGWRGWTRAVVAHWQHVVVTVTVAIFAFVLGALVGSFVNVVLWRVPRGESVVHPGSHCPACDTPLRAYELVPVLSWVALRGRCRTCHAHISARYPLVELGCAVLFGLVAAMVVAVRS